LKSFVGDERVEKLCYGEGGSLNPNGAHNAVRNLQNTKHEIRDFSKPEISKAQEKSSIRTATFLYGSVRCDGTSDKSYCTKIPKNPAEPIKSRPFVSSPPYSMVWVAMTVDSFNQLATTRHPAVSLYGCNNGKLEFVKVYTSLDRFPGLLCHCTPSVVAFPCPQLADKGCIHVPTLTPF